MRIFELTKSFPKEEQYSLTDRIRRSSRSVCASLAEAWRKRRYEAAFVLKPERCRSRGGRDTNLACFFLRMQVSGRQCQSGT